MRTTLDSADDVLFAAKEIAKREKKSLGQTISELARRAFTQPNDASGLYSTPAPSGALQVSERLASYGISPLPAPLVARRTAASRQSCRRASGLGWQPPSRSWCPNAPSRGLHC